VVSIASIRGRARGAGSEFVLACDLRFASRENTLLGQWEVGVGVVPGGGPMARLSRLVGLGRALEKKKPISGHQTPYFNIWQLCAAKPLLACAPPLQLHAL
jgi:enoyl-CoA hydratase/carnithine racemase